MKAKVVKAFPGRPDNEIRTRTIEEGEVISGDLAQVAVREEWAEVVEEDAPPADEQKTLDDMNLDELKAYAKERNIDLGGVTKKAEVRAAIDAAEAQPKPLAEMNVEEMKALAAEKNIDLGDASEEADIRAAIELALEGQQ